MTGTPRRSQVLLVWCATTAAAVGLGWLLSADLWPGAETSLRDLDVETALVQCCEVLLLGCVIWAWAATTAVVVPVWRTGCAPAVRTLGVPVAWRRLVLLACGVALGAGTVPAQAVSGPTYGGEGVAHRTIRASAWALDGLPVPRRPVTTPPAVTATHVTRPAASATTAAVRAVVIAPGDSLWSIAAADLDPTAPSIQIAARCARIHELNRSVIGDDPDLVLPGQRLVLP